MDILAILGIIISIAIAAWEYTRAEKAEKKLEKISQELPSAIVSNIVKHFTSLPPANQAGDAKSSIEIRSTENLSSATYADVNNDGKDELIVNFPIGAHGSAVQVYSLERGSFGLLAELSTDVPSGFELDYSDPTYSPLFRTGETNRSSGLPYVFGLRDIVWYRLEGNKFVEHRREPPTKEEFDRLQPIPDQYSSSHQNVNPPSPPTP